MKKMMLLAGLLCICGLSYAATSDNFNVKARVVEPLAIELNNHTLDFGNVIRGTTGMAKNTVTATITGEQNSHVRVNFKVNEEDVIGGEVALKNEKGNELTAKLYLNNNPEDVMEVTAFTLNDNGKIDFDITGSLDVPTETASGVYLSEDVVVSVVYDQF